MANLIDVTKEFGTEEACLAYLEKLRWPSGVCCLNCGSDRISRIRSKGRGGTTRHLYQCLEKGCRHQFTAKVGTIFNDSHLPLEKWFLAVALMCDAKKSLSALQMQRHLDVAYRTAWYLCHRIRKAMEQEGGIFGGTVEVDETFVGGRFDKRRKRGPYDKQAVVGLVKRAQDDESSKVRAFPIPTPSKAVLVGVVKDHVAPDAKVYTDEYGAYSILDKHGYLHETVKHKALQWRRGDVHTNSIENFWSLFKRGLIGSFHKVSVKHLHRYLDEFSYRFNGRGLDLFTPTLRQLVGTPKMTYRRLVATDSAS